MLGALMARYIAYSERTIRAPLEVSRNINDHLREPEQVLSRGPRLAAEDVAIAAGTTAIDRPPGRATGRQLRIPKQASHLFRIDVGHRSDLMPARVPR